MQRVALYLFLLVFCLISTVAPAKRSFSMKTLMIGITCLSAICALTRVGCQHYENSQPAVTFSPEDSLIPSYFKNGDRFKFSIGQVRNLPPHPQTSIYRYEIQIDLLSYYESSVGPINERRIPLWRSDPVGPEADSQSLRVDQTFEIAGRELRRKKLDWSLHSSVRELNKDIPHLYRYRYPPPDHFEITIVRTPRDESTSLTIYQRKLKAPNRWDWEEGFPHRWDWDESSPADLHSGRRDSSGFNLDVDIQADLELY